LEEKYRRMYERLSLRLIGETILSGAPQAAEDRLYACLLADPLNEEFYRQLLRLFSSKDQNRRIQQFYIRLMQEHS
jgi:DNA-binding SARP family transcriptional activator